MSAADSCGMSIRGSPACAVPLEELRPHVAATRIPQNPETEWIDDIGIDFDEQKDENNNIDADEQYPGCDHHVQIVAVCSSTLALCC